MKNLVKESILRLAPYQNGNHCEKLIKQHKKTLKLDSNESTIAPSPRVLTALMQAIQNSPLHWYPDVESSALCRALARYTGLPRKNILTFNGSDHALETLARCFLNSGDEVILFHPTYDHFRVYVESCDAVIRSVDETESADLSHKIGSVKTARSKLVYIVNPNNPTGFVQPKENIRKALADHPDLLFIIDEAYFEFCSITMADLVPHYGNMVVTRSFSKAFGLAALRCGYTLANAELTEQIAKIRVGKNINALAQIAARASLEDLDHLRRYVEEVKTSKEWLLEKFTSIGLESRNTPINFVLVRVANPAKTVAGLKKNGVYVRDRSGIECLSGMLRITVGDLFMMKRFWQVFEKLPQECLFGEAGALTAKMSV